MRHQYSLSIQRALRVCYSTYHFVCWSCIMEANAPGDAAQAAAKPQNGKIKRHLRTVDEKWWFNHWTQQEPDRALSAYISKFNAHRSNPLVSLAV